MVNEETALQVGFRIRGRVQGVGFRWWARQTGADLGLYGVVLNGPDGSVGVHAVGDGEAIEGLATALSEGPLGCHVDGIDRVLSDRQLPDAFEIISDFGLV